MKGLIGRTAFGPRGEYPLKASVPITGASIVVGRKCGVWFRALCDPVGGHDRLVVPASLLKVEFPDARQITCGDTKRDSRMPRHAWFQPFEDVTRLEILHSERLGNSVGECLLHPFTRKLFERSANNVKIPVVVVPPRSGLC